MKRFIAAALAIGCLSGIICTISACGDNTNTGYPAETSNAVYAGSEIKKTIEFKGESINLEQYAALIAMYEMISFEEIPIENDSDFREIAVQLGQEELYELHLFMVSLTSEEAEELFQLFLENV